MLHNNAYNNISVILHHSNTLNQWFMSMNSLHKIIESKFQDTNMAAIYKLGFLIIATKNLPY